MPNFKYEKWKTFYDFNSTKKKKKGKIRNEKCKRGDDRDQIPLLLSYQSHRWPETHKTWPSFAHRFWRAKNPAPLVKVSHIVATLPPLSCFLSRFSNLFPLKALETEDKSKAHLRRRNLKKIGKLANFKVLGIEHLYNTLISFLPFDTYISSCLFVFPEQPLISSVMTRLLLSLVEAAQYERISRLNARHFIPLRSSIRSTETFVERMIPLFFYNDTWNYFISLFQSSIDFFHRGNKSNEKEKIQNWEIEW